MKKSTIAIAAGVCLGVLLLIGVVFVLITNKDDEDALATEQNTNATEEVFGETENLWGDSEFLEFETEDTEIFEEPEIEQYKSSYGVEGDLILDNNRVDIDAPEREKNPVFSNYLLDRDHHVYEHNKHGDGGFWCKHDRDDYYGDRDR